MIVYADDSILISPEKHETQIWEELDKHILFKDPAAPVTRFLGINHDIKILGNGTCSLRAASTSKQQSKYMKEIGVTLLLWVPSPLIEDKFEK